MVLEPEGSMTWEKPQDIADMQKNYETLKTWFERVTAVDGVQQGPVSSLAEESYEMKNGILYQIKGKKNLLTVPAVCRTHITCPCTAFPMLYQICLFFLRTTNDTKCI